MKKILILLLSLITSSGFSQLYILNEDFATATGTTPPANWQNNTMIGPAAAKWHFDNPGSRTVNYPLTPPFAILDAPSVSPDTALEVVSLETPFFDASVGSYTLLFFDHYFFPDSAAKASILAYNGSTWTEVVSYTVSSTVNPVSEVIDLTGICAGKTNAKLRFQWEGHGKGYWAIDNIRIYAPLFLDAGISQIDAPTMPFNSGVQDVKVTLKNYGYQTLSTATIKWSVNGVMQPPFSWNGTIPFGSASSNINIGSFNFQSGATNQVKIWSDMPNGNPDQNQYNDSTNKLLRVALCGVYTIGGVNPDFQTFGNAADYLNNAGVSCPVVFKIRNGIYQEQVELNPIPGSSVTSTVTFESESGDSSKVTIQNNIGITFSLNSTSHVILNQLGFSGPTSIFISNAADDINISNCKIVSGWYQKSLYIQNSTSNIKVLHTFFDGFQDGMHNIAINLNNIKNVLVKGNRFIYYPENCIYGSGKLDSLVIKQNLFDYCRISLGISNDSVFFLNNTTNESFIQVNSSGPSAWCLIQGNKIAASGSCLELATRNCLVSNNYLTISGILISNGIVANNCTQLKIVFNNIYVLNSHYNSKCLLINGGSFIEIKNNIFSNPSGGYSAYISNNPTSCLWDYNDYYNTYNKIGFKIDSTYQSFSSWATAISGEGHGINVNPFFTNEKNLTPHHFLLNDTGIPVAEIQYDIDSLLRNPNTPDIGAKEFSPCFLDVGISQVTAPLTPFEPGNQFVKVILQNHGTVSLNFAAIEWKINGSAQPSYNWSGNLAPGQNIEVSIGSYMFQSGVTYIINAWTNNPNNGVDCDHYNDSIVSPRTFSKLCGTYTIGGTNPTYSTFNEAVSVLTYAGITCPVIFKVRNGTYLELVEIKSIPGSSSINTVTFESESGDSSQVIIYYQDNGQPTLKIVGANNVFFKKLSIKKHSNGMYAVSLDGNSENISFNNCHIISEYNAIGIYVRNTKSVTINKNLFTNNYYGYAGIDMANVEHIQISRNKFRWGGSYNPISGSNSLKNIDIINNDIVGEGGKIGLINYTGDSIFITCNKLTATGIEIKTVNSNAQCWIKGNRLTLTSTGRYGIILNTQNCVVANNYVGVYGINPRNGIEANNCSQTKFIFNNIHVTNTNANSNCILLNGGASLIIKNNIFSNSGGGYSAYVSNNPTSTSWDYNDYYNTYKKTGYLNNSIYQSFPSWALAIGGEGHGVSCYPFFANDSLLIPHQILLNDVGLPIPGISYDIDSVLRNPLNPDIGAKEFTPCNLDAGINAITAPVTPLNPGLQDVKVILQNQGATTLTAVTINWTVNGVVQPLYSWSGVLSSAQNVELVIGTFSFQEATKYLIKAWTTNPNNSVDCDHLNDSIVSARLFPKLCGSYTIGGSNPDFLSVSETIEFLNYGEISCAVTFKIRNGNYYVGDIINHIQGSSASNTVTYESEQGDSSKVTLNYNNRGSGYCLKLEGADYVRFKKIGFNSLGSRTFTISGTCQHLLISNILFRDISYIWIQTPYHINDLTTSNNRFAKGGSIMRDRAQGNFSKNIFITDNSFYNTASQPSSISLDFWIAGSDYYNCDSIYIQRNYLQNGVVNNWGFGFADVSFNQVSNDNGRALSISSGKINLHSNRCSSKYEGVWFSSDSAFIMNNFINIIGVNNGSGLISQQVRYLKCIYNTISVKGQNTTGNALLIKSTNKALLKNNIFVNSGGGYGVYLNPDALNLNFDFNNYYCSSEKIGCKSGTTYTTLASWASAIGGEANGRNLNPYFANDSSYKTYQRGLNGAGIPVPGVLFDIEGKIRNDQAPDIGCWEFMVDFGITQVLHPTLACSHNPNDSLTIWIRQYGDIPFTNVKLAFRINNGPVHYDTIIGTIYNDILYTFKQRINITNQGDYTIKCWLVDNVDDNVNNDTITVSRYSYPSPVVDFTHTYPCQGQPVQFNGTATIEPPYSIASYEWIFGDGDTAYVQNPLHIFQHPGNKTVTLMAYNNMGCYKDTSKTIAIQPSPEIAISGPDTVCRGSSGLVYATQTGKSNYTWSVSSGGVITSGPGTSTITVTWNNSGDQWIRVNYQNSEGCQAAEPAMFPVFINDVPAPTISGPANICDKTTPSAYTTEPGMSNYSWNISQGGTITGGAGTQSVTVTWSEAGDHSVSVTYQNAGGCMAQSPVILPVTVYGEVPPAGLITGDTLVCSGTPGHGYQIAPLPHATSYSWAIPLGATITGGAGTNHITVSFSNSTGTGHFAVYGKNLCFNGVPSPNLKVTVNTPPVGYQALKNLIIPGGNEECIAAQGITTAGGGTVFAVQPQAKVKLIASEYIHLYHGTSVQPGGYLKATVTDLCIPCNTLKALAENSWFGNDPSASLNITAEESILAYPNPTTGKFFIKIYPDIFSGDRTITIFNLTGEMILCESFTTDEENVYSLEQHPAGIYLVKISDGFTTRHSRIIKME